MSYPNESIPYNQTTNPIVKLAQYNSHLDHQHEKCATIIIRPNGSYFEAIKGGTNTGAGTVIFGSQYNVGSVNGSVLLDVANAAIASLTEGLIIFKDLDIPAVTAKDGVILRSFKSGVEQTKVTNPTSEVATVTNTQNARVIHYLAEPTNDPPTLDAWSTISAEIDIPATYTKYGVAGYFGAIARAGSSGFIWGLNPLVWLEAGCTGNAIGVEVDVNNYAAADKGEGVTVMSNNGNNLYSAFRCGGIGTARWNRSYLAEKFKYYGFIASHSDASAESFTALFPSGMAGFGEVVRYNNVVCYTQTQAAGVLAHYHINLSGVDADVINSKHTGDTEPRFRLTSGGSMFWGSGSATVDVDLTRDVANGLKTDMQFYAGDGIVPKVKAGTISDADLTNTSKVGVLGVDYTNNRIYFRTGTATWHYCAATAGFQIPKEEKHCGVCGEPIVKGEFVCGQIEKEMEDGALHGLWVHLKCAT